MSRAALCALALAGCNQVFGLDPTVSLDANIPDVLPAGPGRVRLLRKRANVTGAGPGAPMVDVSRITNARVRAGLVSGQLIDLAPDPMDLTIFVVPAIVLEEPSRVEITFADGSPPVEIVWPDDAQDVELVIPEVGHTSGDELAPNEQWSVTLAGGPATVQKSAVIATGSWLSWQGDADDNPIDVLWARAIAYADSRVRPASSRGDYTFALELAGSGPCARRPIGFGAFPPPALGITVATTSTWFTRTTTLTTSWNIFDDLTTAALALDDLATVTPVSRFALGYALSPDIVTRAWRVGPHTPTRMEGPGMVPLLECDPQTMGQPAFTPIRELQTRYGELAYGSVLWRRVLVDNPGTDPDVTADSGFEIVARVIGDDMAPRSTALARGVAFPATDATTSVSTIEICSNATCRPLTADRTAIGRSSDTDLRFISEAAYTTDFWSITLVRVEPSGLVPLRIFLTQTPLPPPDPPPDPPLPPAFEASFDLSDATRYPAGEYLFIIRGHLGWPRARFGDFMNHQLPYQLSTTSTFTFSLP